MLSSDRFDMNQTVMMPKVEVFDDERTIPLKDVQQAYDAMPYGTPTRVMFGMLAITGCRIKELDRMRRSMIYGDVLHWSLGKRQRKIRRVRLPSWYLSELRYMHAQEAMRGDVLFPISSESFTRYFTSTRGLLGGSWTDQVIRYSRGEPILQYRLQLNGLRKNYMTILFNKKWRKWEDANVALEMTCSEAKHSSSHITANHYIKGFERLGILRSKDFEPLNSQAQATLGEWL